MKTIQASERHLEMSDAFMRDASSGVLSPRGAFDAIFDGGYFALLSVLTDEERRSHEHPSPHVVEIACRRLKLETARGLFLQSLRYSGDDIPPLAEAFAWAESVRARVRELGIP